MIWFNNKYYFWFKKFDSSNGTMKKGGIPPKFRCSGNLVAEQFTRKVDSYLRQWKDKENRLPLIIKGARQIGKTESIVHFASENYENIVFINFVLEGQYKTILSDGYCHFFEGF